MGWALCRSCFLPHHVRLMRLMRLMLLQAPYRVLPGDLRRAGRCPASRWMVATRGSVQRRWGPLAPAPCASTRRPTCGRLVGPLPAVHDRRSQRRAALLPVVSRSRPCQRRKLWVPEWVCRTACSQPMRLLSTAPAPARGTMKARAASMRLKTVSSQAMVARQDRMMLGLVCRATPLAGIQGLRNVRAGRSQAGIP